MRARSHPETGSHRSLPRRSEPPESRSNGADLDTASLLALQRTAGNRAVVARLTTAAAYPAGTGTRYKNQRNIDSDVENDVSGVAPLAGGAAFISEDAGFKLTVQTGTADAPDTTSVAIAFAGVDTPDYTPTSYDLSATAPWQATIRVHAKLPRVSLLPSLTRELNEIAFRVKAALTNGGTAAGADAQRKVFRDGPTPADATPTSNDRATALELKAIWDVEQGPGDRALKALAEAGLGAPQSLPIDDKKFLELRAVGFTDAMIGQLLASVHKTAFTTANPNFPADVLLDPDLIAHLVMPEYRASTFATTGLTGGHLDPLLKNFAATHPVIHLTQEGTSGSYRKYFQYRWTAGTPKPQGPDDLPKSGEPVPTGWEQAKDTAGAPLPKSTFEDLQGFLKDALGAFRKWATDQPATVTQAATANFGLGQPAAVSADTGQEFGGYYVYDSAKKKWTIKTIFPLV